MDGVPRVKPTLGTASVSRLQTSRDFQPEAQLDPDLTPHVKCTCRCPLTLSDATGLGPHATTDAIKWLQWRGRVIKPLVRRLQILAGLSKPDLSG